MDLLRLLRCQKRLSWRFLHLFQFINFFIVNHEFRSTLFRDHFWNGDIHHFIGEINLTHTALHCALSFILAKNGRSDCSFPLLFWLAFTFHNSGSLSDGIIVNCIDFVWFKISGNFNGSWSGGNFFIRTCNVVIFCAKLSIFRCNNSQNLFRV